jgi:hypothetical protein
MYVRIHVKLHCVQVEILNVVRDIIARLRAQYKQIIILTLAYLNSVTVVFPVAVAKRAFRIPTAKSTDM